MIRFIGALVDWLTVYTFILFFKKKEEKKNDKKLFFSFRDILQKKKWLDNSI